MKIIITCILVLSSLFTKLGYSQITLELLKDINLEGNSYPSNFIIHEDQLYFRATNGIDGSELWTSDGTTEGTEMLVEINPDGSSIYSIFGEADGVIYFSGSTSGYDFELWKTDGTALGTELVKNINETEGSGSLPFWLGTIDDEVYFIANDDINGRELWVTEGTAISTNLLKDIKIGADDSGISRGITFNNELYFGANDGVHGSELWKTDGTVANTVMLKDINLGTGHGFYRELIEFDEKLFFSGFNETTGKELWVSDGTEEGTFLLKDINPFGDSDPNEFFIYNEKLYFQADDGVHARELWVTDGTSEGTQMLVELRPGDGFYGSSYPNSFAEAGGILFFSADSGEDGNDRELWKTNGTAEGTVRVKDIHPTNGGLPEVITAFGNKVYFKARDDSGNGLELWYSDGTAEGTQKVVPPSGINYNPLRYTEYFVEFNGSLYFRADYDNADSEIWKLTDPTASISPPLPFSYLVYPNPVNELLTIVTEHQIQAVEIFNLTGNCVLELKGGNQFNMSDLAPGIYFVQVTVNGKSVIKKIIKN